MAILLFELLDPEVKAGCSVYKLRTVIPVTQYNDLEDLDLQLQSLLSCQQVLYLLLTCHQ
jgi:hypothetical protein